MTFAEICLYPDNWNGFKAKLKIRG